MTEAHIITTKHYHSPCGTLLLGAYNEKLCLCDWVETPRHQRVKNKLKKLLKATEQEGESKVIRQARRQLEEYFSEKRQTFNLPCLFLGTTFQQRVWKELLNIPYGQTCTYKEIAQRIGAPDAVRAVAGANGANAISIIVPCHRVIGSDHSLTGYAGGLAAKKILLQLEKGNMHLKLQ